MSSQAFLIDIIVNPRLQLWLQLMNKFNEEIGVRTNNEKFREEMNDYQKFGFSCTQAIIRCLKANNNGEVESFRSDGFHLIFQNWRWRDFVGGTRTILKDLTSELSAASSWISSNVLPNHSSKSLVQTVLGDSFNLVNLIFKRSIEQKLSWLVPQIPFFFSCWR